MKPQTLEILRNSKSSVSMQRTKTLPPLLHKNTNVHKKLLITKSVSPKPSEKLEKKFDDIDVLCRACANSNPNLLPIFHGKGAELDLITKIHKYLPIRISEDDSLSSYLCCNCTLTINAFHNIVEGCLEAEQKLIRLHEDRLQKISQEEETTANTEHDDIKDPEEFNAEPPGEKVVDATQDKDEENSKEVVSREVKTKRSSAAVTLITQRKLRNALKTKNSQDNSKSTAIMRRARLKTEESLQSADKDAPKSPLNKKKQPQASESSQKLQRYACKHCNFHTTRKKFLANHVADVHPELSETTMKRFTLDKKCIEAARMEVEGRVYYHCKECGKNLFSPYTFSWHMRIHTGERPFTCHLCGKQFRVNQGLSRHLKETHAKMKNFSCDICDRMFASKRNVEDHRRTHTGERPYVCNLCGKTFTQKASLFVHNRTHTDIFPFKCSYCDQAFRTKPVLMVHVTKHTGEKPYLCDICGKGFRIKYELKRHRVVHFDEKPWKCTDCNLSFRQRRYLVNHRKSHGNPTVGRLELIVNLETA